MPLIYIILGILAAIILFFISIFAPLFRGVPFDPSSAKDVERIVKISGAKKGDKVADLGSGDGRIVIAFAKKGIEAHGFEINPLLVLISRWRIKNLGLQKKAFIHWKNFWKENLGKYGIIVSFQIGYIMKPLEEKVKKETRKKTKIISNTWKIRGLRPKKSGGKIYLYEFSGED